MPLSPKKMGESFGNCKKHITFAIAIQKCIASDIGIWCNGNTTDSGPVILGSSPGIPTFYYRLLCRAGVFVCTVWCQCANFLFAILFLLFIYSQHIGKVAKGEQGGKGEKEIETEILCHIPRDDREDDAAEVGDDRLGGEVGAF